MLLSRSSKTQVVKIIDERVDERADRYFYVQLNNHHQIWVCEPVLKDLNNYKKLMTNFKQKPDNVDRTKSTSLNLQRQKPDPNSQELSIPKKCVRIPGEESINSTNSKLNDHKLKMDCKLALQRINRHLLVDGKLFYEVQFKSDKFAYRPAVVAADQMVNFRNALECINTHWLTFAQILEEIDV